MDLPKPNSYRYIDDIAPSDAAFEVSAEKLEDLFVLSAEAMFNIIADIKDVFPNRKLSLKLESDSLDELLYLYLSELLYLKDTERMIFSKFAVNIKGKFYLASDIFGMEIDELKNPPNIDVKAITFHRFKVKQTEDGYYAMVIVDL